MLSPHNPDVLYHGFNVLHRSMDRGVTWEQISPDLTYNDTSKLGDISYQTIFSISESPLRFGLIYAGTDDGRVHITRNGGTSWNEIATELPRGTFIAELVASAYDEGTVYMAQNGKRDDDFTPYVWKSTDYGRTWTSIAAGIPSGPVNVIQEDPKNRNVLYVGTDVGAYTSFDGGGTWHVLSSGLPSTFVHDIVIHPRDDTLVAATHGRGMYALDVRPLQQLRAADIVQDVFVLTPDPAVLPPQGGRGFGGFGAPLPSASVWYWLRTAGPVTIEVKNASGEVVNRLTGSGDAGLNRATWSFSAGGRGGRGGGAAGAATLPAPGVYTVEVRQGNALGSAVLQLSRRP